MEWEDIFDLVLDNLSNDLLTKEWQRSKKLHPTNETFGHCYVVSETLYHMLGGKQEGWTPQRVRMQGATHWFLKHQSGAILDLTASQFDMPVPYQLARGSGFLTKQPSKRSLKLLKRIQGSPAWQQFMKKSSPLTSNFHDLT
jgi:hypothetical protein